MTPEMFFLRLRGYMILAALLALVNAWLMGWLKQEWKQATA